MPRETGNQRQMHTSRRGTDARLGAHVQETYGEAGKGRDAPLKHWHVAEMNQDSNYYQCGDRRELPNDPEGIEQSLPLSYLVLLSG